MAATVGPGGPAMLLWQTLMVPRTIYGSHNWSATGGGGGTDNGRGGPTMAATIDPGDH